MIRAQDAEHFVDSLIRHGPDRAASEYGVDEDEIGQDKDTSLGDTPSRDPRRFGVKGAYPRAEKPSDDLLHRLYEEVGVYANLVDQWAEDTWAEGWQLVTDNEAWATQAQELDEALGTRDAYVDADRRHIMFGTALAYYNLADATGDPEDEPGNVREVLRIQPVPATMIRDHTVDEDPNSDRHGEVAGYKVEFKDGKKNVHWQRVVQLREYPKAGDRVEGVARARRALDDILGLENVKWSAYESFHQRAAPLLVANVDPNARMNPDKADKVKEDIDALQSHVIQKVVAEGFELEPLGSGQGSGLVNPKSYVEVAQDSIASDARIPKHVLFGTAAGALATAKEDTRRYYGRVSRRQETWAAKVLRTHYKRLAEWGLIPDVPNDLTIEFRSLDEPTQGEVFEAEEKRARTLQHYRAMGEEPPSHLVDYEAGEWPGGEPAPKPEAEWEREMVLAQDADGVYREHAIFAYAGPGHAHDAKGIEVPELVPVRQQYQARILDAFQTWLGEYLDLFQEDERLGDLPEEAIPGGDVDPDDELVQALLGLDLDPEEMDAVLFDLLRASAMVGGQNLFVQLNQGTAFGFIDDTPIRLFQTIAQSTADTQARRFTQNIRQSLSQGIADGEALHDLRARVIQEFDMAAHKAEMIARSETMRGYNLGSREAMRQAGLDRFEFNAFNDACEICSPLDGDEFTLRNTSKIPPLHPQCRCTIVALEEDVS